MASPKLSFIIFLLLSSLPLWELNSQNEASRSIPFDHHVHFFSKNLTDDIRNQGYALTVPDSTLNDIEIVLQKNKAQHMILVSGGYAYSRSPVYLKKKTRKSAVQGENDLLARFVAQHPDRLLGFFGLNPMESFAFREMKRCHKKLQLDGLKLHFNASRVNLRDAGHRKKVRKMLAYAADHQLPVLLHLKNNRRDFGRGDVQLFIEEILQKIPPLRLILAHMGGDGGFTVETKAVMETFIDFFQNNPKASDHQIYFELSGAVIYQSWEYPGKVPYEKIAELIRKIGLAKILYGSDYPVMPTQDYLQLLKQYLPITKEELNRIMNNTPFKMN